MSNSSEDRDCTGRGTRSNLATSCEVYKPWGGTNRSKKTVSEMGPQEQKGQKWKTTKDGLAADQWKHHGGGGLLQSEGYSIDLINSWVSYSCYRVLLYKMMMNILRF